MKYTSEEYVEFVDSDDMLRPDMIVKFINTIEKNGCDISITSVHIYCLSWKAASAIGKGRYVSNEKKRKKSSAATSASSAAHMNQGRIAYQNKDITSKLLAENSKEKLPYIRIRYSRGNGRVAHG